MLESPYILVVLEPPFLHVAVLKYAFAVEVMLAHRPVQALDSPTGHRVWQLQFSPRQMEYLLVPVNVVEVEVVAVLHVPVAQLQSLPASQFVNDDLPTLDLGLVAVRDIAEYLPRLPLLPQSPVVRPENGPRLLVLLSLEQKRRIDYRDVVRVQE